MIKNDDSKKTNDIKLVKHQKEKKVQKTNNEGDNSNKFENDAKTMKSKPINEEEILPPKKCRATYHLKRKPIILILTLILIIVIFIIISQYNERKLYHQQQEIILNIKSHYNKYVKVNQETSLYRLENNDYKPIGLVYPEVQLTLEEQDINQDTKYFYSKELDSYISYETLTPIDELAEKDQRYQRYLLFNENVITKEKFTLYSKDGVKKYQFFASMDFPIIVKESDRYYVEYDQELLYIMKSEVEKTVKSNNSKDSSATSVTTLCYHRIYDTNEKCNDIYICRKKSKFDQEMKYLKDNGYLTLTMEEMYWYLTGKVRIPKKSVLITMDDGYLIKSAIDVLEKHQLNASLFVITGRFKDLKEFSSPYLELHSHTNNLHTASACTGYGNQGGGILCLPKNTVLNDLKTSRERLNNPIALAYPFYDYNNRAIDLLKEAGFKLAFAGALGVKGRARQGGNVYKVPRMTIYDSTSFETWKNYL